MSRSFKYGKGDARHCPHALSIRQAYAMWRSDNKSHLTKEAYAKAKQRAIASGFAYFPKETNHE